MSRTMRHAVATSARAINIGLIILTLLLKDGWSMAEVSLFLELTLDLWHQARTIAIDTAGIHLHIVLFSLQETLPIFAITDFDELD